MTEKNEPRRIGDFTKVPHWNDTDALAVLFDDMVNEEFVIKEWVLGRVEGQDEEHSFDSLAVLANLDDGQLVKFQSFSAVLFKQAESIPKDMLPLRATIKKQGSGTQQYYSFE